MELKRVMLACSAALMVTSAAVRAQPVIRLGVERGIVSTLPGDTVAYKVKYDNDGTVTTGNTVIENILPPGVTFLDTVSVFAGNGSPGTLSYRHASAGWLDHIPTTPESVSYITGLRLTIPAGIAAHAGDAAGDAVADDSTGTDAGYLFFYTRIGRVGGDSLLVNGWWDGLQAAADQQGEMTALTGGTYSGVHLDSMRTSDSLHVDSCFAISSLESLYVLDAEAAAAYDTVFFPLSLQNQGNVTDSLVFVVSLVDTADSFSFMPGTFDLVQADSVTPLAGVDSINAVTRRYGTWLPQGGILNVIARISVPGPLTAADGDTLRIAVNARDNRGTGAWDAWPDTVGGFGFGSSRRYVRDTLGSLLHTNPADSTMLDFGDNQYDTVFIAVAAPAIRIASGVTGAGFTGKPKPGDTLRYTVRYDNDGAGATRDTTNIVNILPADVTFIGVDSLAIDTARIDADSIDVDYLYGTPAAGNWLENLPYGADSLLRITGLRFQVPPGIGAHRGDNSSSFAADDSLDADAGFIRYTALLRYAGAESLIVNGWWDSTFTTADQPGELTAELAGTFSGLATPFMTGQDTLTVDSCFAFSSLESLNVTDAAAVPYDTVYFQYVIQNYANVLRDSFLVLVNIVDTTNAIHFPVTDLDITKGPAGGAPTAGLRTGGNAVDSIYYGCNLAVGMTDTFYIRVVVPGSDSAANDDSINLAVRIRNQAASGTFDAWPDTVSGAGLHSPRRMVVDTTGAYLHTSSLSGTDSRLLDFGDTQYDTVSISVGAPVLRAGFSVTRIGFTGDPRPGDTLAYTIKYDNDGPAATAFPAYITNQLPMGVSFIGTQFSIGGNGNDPTVEASYSLGPWTSVSHDGDSLRHITGLRFTVPAGIAAHAGTDAVTNAVADDSVGHAADDDAGFIRYLVRVNLDSFLTAGKPIVNGWWDGTDYLANAPGELTINLGGTYTGVPADSLSFHDTLSIDSCYAMSSLAMSGSGNPSSSAPDDTVYFSYFVQNYGTVTDSFVITASVIGTGIHRRLAPIDFEVLSYDSTTKVGAETLSTADTLVYGFRLAHGSVEAFVIRAVIPDTARADDTLHLSINIRCNAGNGTYDAWPDTVTGSGFGSAARVLPDTHRIMMHTGSVDGVDDCILDYGDDQTIDAYLRIALAPEPPNTVQKHAITDTGAYEYSDVDATVKILTVEGTDTLTVAVTRDEYPPAMHLLDHPVPRFYEVTHDTGITSVEAVLTFSYTDSDFVASGLTDEGGMFCVRYTDDGWMPYPSIVDTLANTVSCTTTGFSLWAIDGICRGIGCPACTVSFNSIPPTATEAGTLFTYAPGVTGGSPKQLVSAPAGMLLCNDTLFWQTDSSDLGIHHVVIWCNGICMGDSQAFDLAVVPVTDGITRPIDYGRNVLPTVPEIITDGIITFTLVRPHRYSISTSTSTGNASQLIPLTGFPAGTHSIRLPASYHAGMYVIRFSEGTAVQYRKVLLLR